MKTFQTFFSNILPGHTHPGNDISRRLAPVHEAEMLWMSSYCAFVSLILWNKFFQNSLHNIVNSFQEWTKFFAATSCLWNSRKTNFNGNKFHFFWESCIVELMKWVLLAFWYVIINDHNWLVISNSFTTLIVSLPVVSHILRLNIR